MAEAEGHRYDQDDARNETTKLKSLLSEAAQLARQAGEKTSNPKAQALFETTAEVLGGLTTAYEHYQTRTEPAWK